MHEAAAIPPPVRPMASIVEVVQFQRSPPISSVLFALGASHTCPLYSPVAGTLSRIWGQRRNLVGDHVGWAWGWAWGWASTQICTWGRQHSGDKLTNFDACWSIAAMKGNFYCNPLSNIAYSLARRPHRPSSVNSRDASPHAGACRNCAVLVQFLRRRCVVWCRRCAFDPSA